MLAAKRLHFRPAGASEDCYAILATAERLQDLELAASELERRELNSAMVRVAALAELSDWRESGPPSSDDMELIEQSIRALCCRLGVEL